MIPRRNPILAFTARRLPLINLEQKRTSFYNKYKHGPHKLNNPDPEPWYSIFGDFFKKDRRDEMKNDFITLIKWPFKIEFNKKVEVDKTKIFEDFDSDDSIKRWKPVADRDSLNGYSISKFSRSPAGHGLFHGVIDNTIPDDGMTANSGFAAIIGPPPPRGNWLFNTEAAWNWANYNCLEIKYRGDGRKYSVVLNTAEFWSDLSYYDNYAYPLHTRAGPNWQICRIPFSKFIFNYRSFVQDRQGYLPFFKIKFVSFVLHDKIDGPFALEIDHIGLRLEERTFKERSPYETYQFSNVKYRPIQVECEPPERE